MQSDIYRLCCCINGYYNSNYQELDDSDIKLKSTEHLNLISAGLGADYRSVVISNPSSSFEPDTSENDDTEGKETNLNTNLHPQKNLNTNLYNTNNLNASPDNSTMQLEDNSPLQTAPSDEDDAPSPPTFAIESEVSQQRTSWQSASFAMAHASRSTTNNRSKVPATSSSEADSLSDSPVDNPSYTSRIKSRSARTKRRSKNEANAGSESSLMRLKEKMNKETRQEESVPVTAGALFRSLLPKDSGRSERTKRPIKVVSSESEQKTAAQEAIRSRVISWNEKEKTEQHKIVKNEQSISTRDENVKDKNRVADGDIHIKKAEIPKKENVKEDTKKDITAGVLFRSLLPQEKKQPIIIKDDAKEDVKHVVQEDVKIMKEYVKEDLAEDIQIGGSTEAIMASEVNDELQLSDVEEFSNSAASFSDNEEPLDSAPTQPTGISSFQPIQRLIDVFSGTFTAEPPAQEIPVSKVRNTPTSDAITQETSVKFEETTPEKPDDLSDLEDDEVYDSLEDSEDEKASSYSIATSDISTDPTTEDAQEQDLTQSFFPEIYSQTKTDTAQQLTKTNPQLSSRYPQYKPSPSDEDTSSIATDDLSSSIATDDLDSSVQDMSVSDYEDISGRGSGLEVGSIGEQVDELVDSLWEHEAGHHPGTQFIKLDKETGQMVHYDDPNLVETDSAFSFPGRISAGDENSVVGDLENPTESGESPVPSSILGLESGESPVPSSMLDLEDSTIVGSSLTGVSSGADTLQSRVEEKKKKGGLVSRIKKRVMKK